MSYVRVQLTYRNVPPTFLGVEPRHHTAAPFAELVYRTSNDGKNISGGAVIAVMTKKEERTYRACRGRKSSIRCRRRRTDHRRSTTQRSDDSAACRALPFVLRYVFDFLPRLLPPLESLRTASCVARGACGRGPRRSTRTRCSTKTPRNNEATCKREH